VNNVDIALSSILSEWEKLRMPQWVFMNIDALKLSQERPCHHICALFHVLFVLHCLSYGCSQFFCSFWAEYKFYSVESVTSLCIIFESVSEQAKNWINIISTCLALLIWVFKLHWVVLYFEWSSVFTLEFSKAVKLVCLILIVIIIIFAMVGIKPRVLCAC
jgi:hypothetical protein